MRVIWDWFGWSCSCTLNFISFHLMRGNNGLFRPVEEQNELNIQSNIHIVKMNVLS